MHNTKPSLGHAYEGKHKYDDESIRIEFTTYFPELSVTQCDTLMLNILIDLIWTPYTSPWPQ